MMTDANLEHARSLSDKMLEQAQRLVGGGVDPDAVCVAMLDACLKVAMAKSTPDEVADWLRDIASTLPERVAEARTTH
jgi:hypothetical protein